MNDTLVNTETKAGRPVKNPVWPLPGTEFTSKSLGEMNPLLAKATIVKKIREELESGRAFRAGLSGGKGRKSVIYKLS